jgi:hypothetical protein
MSFAPPKQTVSPAARAPAGPARDDPISGRLARAATGVSYDASEGVTVSPGGTRRLWLVESDRAPRSPGVATVAAVSGASSASAAGFGARRGASGTDPPEMDKGPAFSHLTRQNAALAKRLDAAHKHLRRAFGPGRDAQYMTSALRIKSGAQALKCVQEAVPIGDALLANWDAAWGLQLRHLTRGKERAERDLERARAQTELALEEAEAAHLETEAYRVEMDANVDRIERARAVAGELKALEARAADAEARAENHQQKLANADARAAEAGAAAVAAAEARAQAAEARAQTQAAAAADELAALRAELEKTRETMRVAETRAIELEDAAAARSPRSSARVSFGTEKSPSSSARVSERVSDLRSSRARVSAGTKETYAKNITREQERSGVAEKLALDASEARRVAERRADDAETRAAEAEARARAAEVECEAERENARLNREETRRAHDDAAAKQIELQDRVIALQNELKQCRLELEECRGALAGAAATRDVAPQVRAMQETSRKLRRELAAAERVRFAAKLVAEDTHARWRDAAVRGDDEALEETRSRDDASVVFELASRVAAMQAEMAELREKGGAVVGDAIKDGKDGKDTRRGDDDSEVSTLRRRLAEANAHVAVLASSRDKALMESARVRVADSVVARGARDAGTSARTPIVRKNSGLFGVTPVTETLRTGSESLRLEFSPTKQTTFSSNAENFPTAEARADAPAPRIEAARAEAERLVAEAENVGREAFTRLKSASAKFGTNLRAGADRQVRAAPRAKA